MTRSEHQQDLFGDTAPWEDDDVELRTVATIVFPTGPDKEFDYLVPDELLGKLQAGCRVKVPLGRSDRPVFLDDGTLLWISSAGTGRAGWIHDGVRLGGYPELPVPARPDRTRLEEGLVVFDAGDAEYALDPGRRTVKRRGPRP